MKASKTYAMYRHRETNQQTNKLCTLQGNFSYAKFVYICTYTTSEQAFLVLLNDTFSTKTLRSLALKHNIYHLINVAIRRDFNTGPHMILYVCETLSVNIANHSGLTYILA